MEKEPSNVADDSMEDDAEFIPTTDMFIHGDIDDERTIEEEETLDQEDEDEGELDDLMKEGDMPLEELLSMYRYTEMVQSHDSQVQSHDSQVQVTREERGTDEAEQRANGALQEDQQRTAARQEQGDQGECPNGPAHTSPKMLRRSMRLFGNSLGFVGNDSDSDDDEDYEPEQWQREVHIGECYQADVPDTVLDRPEQLDAGEDDNEKGRCLWKPDVLNDKQVRSFLVSLRRERGKKPPSMDSAAASRDDEQALYVLKTNHFDTQKALQLIQTSDSYITEAITPWSEQECRQFELGVKKFGKNFTEIEKLIPTRTMKEVVQFYYLWKKTERRDMFVHQFRPNKKKASQLSQVIDYMDKFLEEEQDSFGGVTLDHLSDLRDLPTALAVQSTPSNSTANSDSEEGQDSTSLKVITLATT